MRPVSWPLHLSNHVCDGIVAKPLITCPHLTTPLAFVRVYDSRLCSSILISPLKSRWEGISAKPQLTYHSLLSSQTLVDLSGRPFASFSVQRCHWTSASSFSQPGPIQAGYNLVALFQRALSPC